MNEHGMYLLQQARATALPLRQTAVMHLVAPHETEKQGTLLSHLDVLPLLWIDAEGRPDVHDVWRVFAQQGDGEIVTRWVYDLFEPDHPPSFYLRCTLTVPVSTSFFVAFPLPDSETLLQTLATCTQLVLLTDTPPATLPRRCSSKELAELLRQGFVLETQHWELPVFLAHWRAIHAQFLPP